MPKATYVPLQVPQDQKSKDAVASAGAVRKFGFVSSLNLQSGEVDSVSSALSVALPNNQTQSPLYTLLKSFEGQPLPSQQPSPSSFVGIPDADLLSFGNALTALRQQTATRLQTVSGENATTAANNIVALNQANTAAVSTSAFTNGAATSPIGMLNLESLEMTPAGIERGGLIATIPLAPKERTIVVQQEWSVISQEFTSIVTDSLDNYSETGVTDNTQLTQSTQSQVAHSNQFNINASVSGSIGFVSGSVATAFTSQDQNSASAATSRSHAIQTTRQASSRSTQAHKMTISTSTTSGTSDTSTRMLENPSSTDPMRIDYFSIMRKWYVALYRYGLRLTYDVTVPEPGAAMREAYRQIAKLQQQASQSFAFNISYSQINLNNMTELEKLAEQYGASIPAPPPANSIQYVPSQTAQTTSDDSQNYYVTPLSLTFTVADGQQIDHIELNYNIGENHGKWIISILGGPQFFDQGAPSQYYEWNVSNVSLGNFMAGATGSVTITCTFQYANPAIVSFNVYTVPTAATIQTWQASVYTALYNAAQTAFYTQQQSINAQITALQQQLNSVDTLTLRREENDEIMKCALRWLLGHNFEFMPNNVVQYFKQQGGADLTYGIDFTGNDTNLSASDWTVVTQNEDRINFINQAIDWDNVLYYVYSYFWDVPQSWDFIRQIQHPDATRQAFLRAGSARVVLTVRQGWEVAWTYFVEFGSTSLPATLPPHPYLTIAQQIEDYDSINYPGIPPADPNGGGPVDDDTPQVGTTCDVNLSPSTSNVNIQVADSTGFVAGATAVIDTWDSGVQETQSITAVPDGTHITVQALSYAHSPTQDQNQPYPIVQAGEKGVLIAEWFEYTPTSGVDIAVTSNLATIT
jgi:hypothetical protein